MRIAFLCSGLEPGRDGVGDYMRSLAAECVRQGHVCALVALNDGKAQGAAVFREMQECDGVSMEALRCPEAVAWEDRVREARAFLADFGPDWISLHYVPYGFHPRGLAWRAADDLRAIVGGSPLQIMFHELWIGFGKGAPLKERLVGLAQRHCIFRTLRMLAPRVVHTSNATYAALLRKGGCSVTELPLFGSIPVLPDPAFPPGLTAAGVPGDGGREGWWIGAFFGTLHPEWKPEPLTGILLEAAQKAGQRVCLVSAGRLGVAGEAVWEAMRRAYAEKIVFLKLGEQTREQISALFGAADFGVASSPWCLMGKSSSAASMLDHGLPVIVTRVEEGGALPEGTLFHFCDEALESKLIAGLPRGEPGRSVGEICARFLAALR